LWLILILSGCATAPKTDRAASGKTLFDQTVKQYHLPSADAKGAARDKLLARAADGYARLLRTYPDQPYWCAQSLRSLANIRAEQGHLDDAIKMYRQVGEHYPDFDWEVLQAWKSAADQLWDAGRQADANPFYQQIVTRFDQPDAPAVYKTIVRAAKARL
jgi:tetratricopeptide (TPR) repeat protein